MILCGQLHGKIGSRRLTRPHGCFFDLRMLKDFLGEDKP
jgi:hypothetical protein